MYTKLRGVYQQELLVRLIMVHGDDSGLVMPPKVAPTTS